MNLIAFCILIGATLLTYTMAEAGVLTSMQVTVIAVAMVVKFLSISFGFLDLRKAHPAWAAFATAYITVMGGSIVFALMN